MPTARYVREWALFTDWCQATDRVPLPATQADVLAFLDEERPAAGTAARLLAGITAAHTAAGHPTPCRGAVTWWVSASRAGTPTTGQAILARLADAVTRVPLAGWPTGAVGRRDRLAYLIHHLGGIAAEDLCTLGTDDLAITGPGQVTLTVHGAPVALYQDQTADPALCLACAATRWAQILRHHQAFAHRVLADKLTATPPGPLATSGRHVCDTAPIPAPAKWWPPGWPLLYGIDHRGRPGGAPVPDPITPGALGQALRGVHRGTWARRPAPLPPARYDSQSPENPPPAPQPEPAPAASNPAWHRDGVTARTRDHALLADVDAALDALDTAADKMEQRMRKILNTQTR